MVFCVAHPGGHGRNELSNRGTKFSAVMNRAFRRPLAAEGESAGLFTRECCSCLPYCKLTLAEALLLISVQALS